jgi:hypothetical protein
MTVFKYRHVQLFLKFHPFCKMHQEQDKVEFLINQMREMQNKLNLLQGQQQGDLV